MISLLESHPLISAITIALLTGILMAIISLYFAKRWRWGHGIRTIITGIVAAMILQSFAFQFPENGFPLYFGSVGKNYPWVVWFAFMALIESWLAYEAICTIIQARFPCWLKKKSWFPRKNVLA